MKFFVVLDHFYDKLTLVAVNERLDKFFARFCRSALRSSSSRLSSIHHSFVIIFSKEAGVPFVHFRCIRTAIGELLTKQLILQ